MKSKMVEIFGYEAAELVDKIDPRQLVVEEDWPTVRDNQRMKIEKQETHHGYSTRT